MLPISASELASIQADAAAAALDLTCVIQRAGSITYDAQGGESSTPTTIATVAAGMSEPTANQLQNYGYLVGDLAAWQVRMPVGTNVLEKDHLTISGQTLTVQKVMTPRSYPGLLTALATELK